MLSTGEQLIEALFGGTGRLTPVETSAGAIVSVLVIAYVWVQRHKLVLALISPEMARTAGIDVARLNLRFLVVFSLTIALGRRFLGVLLIGSLAIIPAATAKRLATNLNGMLTASVAVSVFSTVAGTCTTAMHREAGPVVVLVAGGCFAASLLSPWRFTGPRRDA